MEGIKFLVNNLSKDTGGKIYDFNLYQKLVEKFGSNISLYQEDDFLKTSRNLITYNIAILKRMNELLDCSCLILNSRLYTHFLLFMLFYKRKKCKIVIIHHHYNYLTHHCLFYYIHQYLEIKFLKLAQDIIIPNPYILELTEKNKSINSNLIYLETSFENFHYTKNSNPSKMLLYVGTIEKRKGLIFGLKAFKIISQHFPEYKFIIIGKYNPTNKYYRKLNKFIKRNKLQDSIYFLGRVSDEDLEKYYYDSQIFLFPSLHEGYGMVLVEAMAHGLPVVAFNNSAIPFTVISGQNGYLAINKNYKSLADLVIRILTDSKIYNQLCKGAIDTSNSVKKMDDFYEAVDKYLSYKLLQK